MTEWLTINMYCGDDREDRECYWPAGTSAEHAVIAVFAEDDYRVMTDWFTQVGPSFPTLDKAKVLCLLLSKK